MTDLPAALPDGLNIGAVPEREDPRDALISQGDARFDELATGARIGTASLRRHAQALHRRADLKIELLRGNVETRLRRLDEGAFDAILLAIAGLKRLGLDGRVSELLDPAAAPPAPGQGALAIEVRAEDKDAAWLKALHHPPTAVAVAAERGALEALEGSCRTAVGAHARIEAGTLALIVEALSPDGRDRFRREGAIAAPNGESTAFELGLQLGLQVKAEAGERIVWA
jgi:hydroxymethylbilane synthase